MKRFSVTCMSRQARSVKEAALAGPVIITERNKPQFVMMSFDEFERLAGKRHFQRLSIITSETPHAIQKLLIEALDQPWEP